jgi:hypothetical protein
VPSQKNWKMPSAIEGKYKLLSDRKNCAVPSLQLITPSVHVHGAGSMYTMQKHKKGRANEAKSR